MASITRDTPLEWESEHLAIDVKMKIASTIFAGQLVQHDGTALETVKDIVQTATSGFAGIALTGGVSGDVIDVRAVGILILTSSLAVAAGGEGTTVEIETTAASDNNPATAIAAAGDMPCGVVVRVITANAKHAILIEADGYQGRANAA